MTGLSSLARSSLDSGHLPSRGPDESARFHGRPQTLPPTLRRRMIVHLSIALHVRYKLVELPATTYRSSPKGQGFYTVA
jgi:hypothetical protein